jgi:hypothetical protein
MTLSWLSLLQKVITIRTHLYLPERRLRDKSKPHFEVLTTPTYAGQHKLHEYLRLFDLYGYSLLDIYNPVRRANQMLQADLLFSCAQHLAAA